MMSMREQFKRLIPKAVVFVLVFTVATTVLNFYWPFEEAVRVAGAGLLGGTFGYSVVALCSWLWRRRSSRKSE